MTFKNTLILFLATLPAIYAGVATDNPALWAGAVVVFLGISVFAGGRRSGGGLLNTMYCYRLAANAVQSCTARKSPTAKVLRTFTGMSFTRPAGA